MILMDIFHYFFFPALMAVDQNCDYVQVMEAGKSYYIYNAEYPNYYNGYRNCRWIAHGPENSQIYLTCSVIDISASPNCVNDRLSVSLTGNPQLADGHNYCGSGTLSILADRNHLAIGSISNVQSARGRFSCQIVAITSNKPTTTTTPRPTTCDCGWRQQRRIVGGVETGMNEYPFVTTLIDMPRNLVYCGATLISDKHALTAAHCLLNKDARNFGLLVGAHNLSIGTPSTALYRLEKYILHENYNQKTHENDIAIVVVERTILLSVNVGPVCLPMTHSWSNFVNEQVTIIGYGSTGFSDPVSKVPLSADVYVVDNNICQNKLPNDLIYPSEICAHGNGRDSCTYDSGGPMIWYDRETNRYYLVGIISYGIGCGGPTPSVNTRVTSFLNWIVEKTSKSYCVK